MFTRVQGLLRLQLHKPWITRAERRAVRKVLDSGWLAEGPVTEEFERKVAKYVGAKHAVAVCNCTVAMELCLVAWGITDTVVLPSFTHPATARAVINAGATPILCDVNLATYNMSYQKPLNCEAALPVSWGGNPEWCSGLGVHKILEDAACSLGSMVTNIKTGKLVTSCFSFHPRKLITSGEGGMITTDDDSLALKLQGAKWFGQGNYKLSDLNSALGLAQLRRIEEIITRRRKMAQVYNDLLKGVNVTPPAEFPHTRHTYQTYAVRLNNGNRDKIIEKLEKQDIETQIGTYALHMLPEFRHLFRIGKLENSERLYRNLLALPMAYDLTDEDQHRVVDALKGLVN